jgi:ABC-type phosphate/phosphonate transport system substrate-binding protein
MSRVANARMYAVTPAVKTAWQDLFAWVAKTSGVPLAYLDHAAPAPLEALWTRDDLGAAFMCGFPFASAARRPQPLVAPVPSPPRYAGLPQYCTDLIVRADRDLAGMSDPFAGRIGWTVAHSQSGYNAVRHHLLGRTVSPKPQWVGPLVTPRAVIEAVLNDRVDVGPLDSYVHDLIRRHEPETAEKLRVLESTLMTPIPLLVASPGIDGETSERLRRALLSCHAESALAATLEALLVSHFVAVDPTPYDVLVLRAQDADRAGITKPEQLCDARNRPRA